MVIKYYIAYKIGGYKNGKSYCGLDSPNALSWNVNRTINLKFKKNSHTRYKKFRTLPKI